MATINSTLSNTLLTGTSDNDSIVNSKSRYVTIDTGAGNDSVYSSATNVTINTGTGDDYVLFSGSNVTIDAGEGNDYISSSYDSFVRDHYASIAGGKGKDSIYISYDYVSDYYEVDVTISGGDDNDYIKNECQGVTINGDAGNDYIYNDNHSKYVSINGDTGNDTIENFSSKVTIDGGAGNDSIYSSGNKVKIIGGEGNDIIYGFNSTSTLKTSSSSYSTKKSGVDVLVTVGDGIITLKNAYATADVIHINNESIELERNIVLTGGDNEIETRRDSVSVNGGAGNDSIQNYYGHNVTINGGTGNDTIYNSYYNCQSISITGGAGNDVISNGGANSKLDGGAGDDSISNGSSNTTINAGAGDDSVYNHYSPSVTIDTGKGNDSVYNSSSSSVSINMGTGNDSVYNYYSSNTTINAGAGNDLISLNSYSENVLIVYHANDGNDFIEGFKANSTLSISSGSYSTTKSGDDIIVTVGKGKISLVGAASLSAVNIDFKKTVEENSWKLNGTTATYGTDSKTLVTVKGVKSLDGISLNGTTVTVAASSLNQANVTLTGDGYKLKLGSDVSTTAKTSNEWSYKNSVATLSQTKTAYYSLASDGKTISYSAGTSTTLTKVSGVKSADGLSVSGKVVTVAASSLNKSKVTVTGEDYKLKLANDVSTTATTANSWSYKSSVATLKQTKTAYYSLANNAKSISYSAGTSSTLATVSGVKSASGLSLSGNKITLKNSALSKKVSVSGSYEFDFASDYKKAAITGSAKADTITTRGNNISITGGKGNDQININGANNVVVYKSGDGKDIINGLTEDDTIKIASGASQVSTSGADVIFNVGKGSLTVKDAADKTFTYIASGVKETYSAATAEPYTISGAEIILSSSYTEKDFDVKKAVNGGNGIITIDASAATHELNITGNAKANEILGGKGNDTLDGYTGNDTLTGGAGADIFLYYAGDGNDVITDYAANDTIAIEDGEVIPTVKGRDVVLKVGKGKITVQNAAKNKIGVTYVEDGVEHDYINGKQAVNVNDTAVTITKDYWKTAFDVDNFGSGLKQIDASAVTHKLKIAGNDNANQILGGTGNDTLTGGKGNDTLQGGDGANLYVYNNGDGNDLIVSWGNRDSISIASGVLSDINVKGDTAILKVGKGKISLQGALTEQLNWYDSDGEAHHTILGGANDNVLEDDNFITGNNLSAIVEDKAVDYSVAEMESALPPAKTLPTLSYSKKKS